MNVKINTLFFYLALLLGVPQYLLGQDAQLSQFYEADLLLNPALTGSKHRNRFMFHDRIQWPNLDGRYLNTFFSFDKYFYKRKIGLGSYIKYDEQGTNILTTLTWQLLASYELHLSKKWTLRFGIDAGFYQKKIDDSGLIYPEQVTSNGITSLTNNTVGIQQYTQPDIGGGLVLYDDNFWFGAALSHINAQDQNFIENTLKYPKRFNIIAGYKINLGNTSPTKFTGFVKDFYLFPSIHYKLQGKSDQVEIGSHLINHQLKLGLFYRGLPLKKYNSDIHNNESIIALAGWRLKQWEFTYSYDIVFSELQPAGTGNAHEINISFIFPIETKKIHYKKLPCPDFQKVSNF